MVNKLLKQSKQKTQEITTDEQTRVVEEAQRKFKKQKGC